MLRRRSNLLCRMCRNVVSWTHAGGNWNRQSTLCGMCRNVLSWQVCRICRRVQRWHGARCWHGLRRQGARCGGTRNRRRKGSSLSPEGECRICRNVLSWQGAHAGGSWIRQQHSVQDLQAHPELTSGPHWWGSDPTRQFVQAWPEVASRQSRALGGSCPP